MESIEKEKTTEETIKEFALQNGASVVGIASVEEYNEYVPKFHRPMDILPGAKSFIVLGGTLPFLSPWVSPDIRTIGRLRMNPRFMQSSLLLAGFIEGKFKHYAIAELDIPVDRFWEALEFKDDRCKAYFERKHGQED